MKKGTAHTLVSVQDHGPRLGWLVPCESFSSLHWLLRLTVLIMKFVRLLRQKVRTSSESVSADDPSDADQAILYWLRDA